MDVLKYRTAQSQEIKPQSLTLIPYVLAVFFTGLALVGYNTTDLVDADASRHAMNGALIYDMVRTGHLLHPIQYAQYYYAHFPAITLPYHPPLFPAVEALFYALFGVNAFAARLAVALAVGISAILLYRLVYQTHANHTLAACVVVSMMMSANSRRVASDVMLEFPALVFALAALLVMGRPDRPWTIRRAIAFGLLGGAAVWTKQHTVFLGLAPLAWPVLVSRWRLFLQKSLWLAQGIFWALVGGLVYVSSQARNTGVNQLAGSSNTVRSVFHYTLPTYWKGIVQSLDGWTGIFVACALAAFFWVTYRYGRRNFQIGLYLVWTFTYCLLLIPLQAVDLRYLFFAVPAVMTILYSFLWAGCSAAFGPRRAPYVLAAIAGVWFVNGLLIPSSYLHGPGQVAGIVTQVPGARILYSGDAIGNFIFAVRTHDPNLQSTVIQLRRLPDDVVQPQAFSQFCNQYGIDWVVFGDQSRVTWMLQKPPDAAKMEQAVPLRSTYGWNGTLHLFRWTSPHGHSGGVLKIPIPKIGGGVELKL